jgi:tRNA pseudouridine synthase 10
MKANIENKAKSYCAIVWVQSEITSKDCMKLSEIRDMKVLQKTPVRVLHRRS